MIADSMTASSKITDKLTNIEKNENYFVKQKHSWIIDSVIELFT